MRSLVPCGVVDPLTGIDMTGVGHTQVFLSLCLLRIKLASFSETSVIMDTGVDYYSVPTGALSSSSITSRVGCAPRKAGYCILQLEFAGKGSDLQ